MNAADIMTRDVRTIGQDASTREIARLLVANKISAVPVVDAAGKVVGMVSEGDLARAGTVKGDERRSWWLQMVAEGESLHPDFLKYILSGGKHARDLMTRDVVTVEETTPAAKIAKLLEERRIKRVPVLKDGKLVGIVSRADLLKVLTHDGDLDS